MILLAVITISAVFGAGDQYLGSLGVHWATSTSLLSAPWLVLPFAAGATQHASRRAMALGALSTFTALVAYALMTLSPLEGAHLSLAGLVAFATSSRRVLFGGMVTGPLYGLLGQRWRRYRRWSSALLVAGALCGEPVLRAAVGQLPSPNAVWIVEATLGLALAVIFFHARLHSDPSRAVG